MKLGVRAVLLIGADERKTGHGNAAGDDLWWPSNAPYSKVFRGGAGVHQGWSGDDGANACGRGKPMLMCPTRTTSRTTRGGCKRLKVARVIQRGNYTPMRVARKITGDAGGAQVCAAGRSWWRSGLEQRNGVGSACDRWKSFTGIRAVGKCPGSEA